MRLKPHFLLPVLTIKIPIITNINDSIYLGCNTFSPSNNAAATAPDRGFTHWNTDILPTPFALTKLVHSIKQIEDAKAKNSKHEYPKTPPLLSFPPSSIEIISSSTPPINKL